MLTIEKGRKKERSQKNMGTIIENNLNKKRLSNLVGAKTLTQNREDWENDVSESKRKLRFLLDTRELKNSVHL